MNLSVVDINHPQTKQQGVKIKATRDYFRHLSPLINNTVLGQDSNMHKTDCIATTVLRANEIKHTVL